MTSTAKPYFLEQTPESIQGVLASWNEPGFRAKQIHEWIFTRRCTSVEAMSNLPAGLRQKLADAWDFNLPPIIEQVEAQDGTTKVLLRGEKGQAIETVIMRYDDRTSVCVSSQVGCKMACSFCQTGKLGFFRHLQSREILGQVAVATNILASEGRRVTNIVFMGMGEPLDNFDNVMTAVDVLTSPTGYGISPRRVTVSTSGLVDGIRKLAERSQAALAVSLHASRDDLRTELMPINRRYPLAMLKESLKDYQRVTGNKITIEYLLIAGKNSSERDAKELVQFLNGLKAKVNLIPFNPHPGLPHERPSDEEVRSFQTFLSSRSIPAPVRYSRGAEVSGACGQLAAKTALSLHAVPARKNVLIEQRV